MPGARFRLGDSRCTGLFRGSFARTLLPMDEELPPFTPHEPQEAQGRPVWLKIAVIGSILVGGAVAILLGSDAGNAFTYSKPLTDVVSDPESFEGRELRVEGLLRQGSIQFREDPCEWRFVLEKDEREMAVQFPQCVVPDTFRDGFGITVTVEGTVQSDGTFHASQVVPRCPSKYEMEQRIQSGETMPHDQSAPGA